MAFEDADDGVASGKPFPGIDWEKNRGVLLPAAWIEHGRRRSEEVS